MTFVDASVKNVGGRDRARGDRLFRTCCEAQVAALVEGDDRVIESQPGGLSAENRRAAVGGKPARFDTKGRVGIVAQDGVGLNAPDSRILVADEKSRSRGLRTGP